MEIANRKVWILASPEVLQEMQAGWSRSVQAHAEEGPDGVWEMTFRTAEGAERRVIASARAIWTELHNKIYSHAYDDECGMQELLNSVDGLNLDDALAELGDKDA